MIGFDAMGCMLTIVLIAASVWCCSFDCAAPDQPGCRLAATCGQGNRGCRRHHSRRIRSHMILRGCSRHVEGIQAGLIPCLDRWYVHLQLRKGRQQTCSQGQTEVSKASGLFCWRAMAIRVSLNVYGNLPWSKADLELRQRCISSLTCTLMHLISSKTCKTAMPSHCQA